MVGKQKLALESLFVIPDITEIICQQMEGCPSIVLIPFLHVSIRKSYRIRSTVTILKGLHDWPPGTYPLTLLLFFRCLIIIFVDQRIIALLVVIQIYLISPPLSLGSVHDKCLVLECQYLAGFPFNLFIGEVLFQPTG